MSLEPKFCCFISTDMKFARIGWMNANGDVIDENRFFTHRHHTCSIAVLEMQLFCDFWGQMEMSCWNNHTRTRTQSALCSNEHTCFGAFKITRNPYGRFHPDSSGIGSRELNLCCITKRAEHTHIRK